MKERPILFNGDMVRAILSGEKTQTRRMVNPQPKTSRVDFEYGFLKESEMLGGCWHVSKKTTCPFGEVGDRLWVREAFKVVMASPGYDNGIQEGGDHDFCEGVSSVLYPADEAVKTFCELDDKDDEQAKRMLGRGMPSIHMPRWASRITLEIVGVRVERLQDITDAEARAEGFKDVGAFADCWNSIYKNWHENPWVWVVEFKRIEL